MRNYVMLAALAGSVLLNTTSVFAAEGIGKVFDDQVSTVEREVLGLAQKMPADKYDFAPTSPGTFTGVRTYALQVRHIATYIYRIAASVSGEKAPVEIGPTDNGPDTLKTKDEIIDYFKGALAFAHKAMGNAQREEHVRPGTLAFRPRDDGSASRPQPSSASTATITTGRWSCTPG